MTRVRFAARDPGAANVLASFIRSANLELLGVDYDVWALPVAVPIFERMGLTTRTFSEPLPREQLEKAWRHDPVSALVTGTSHYAPFEVWLWELASESRCPSFAVNDSWVNLERRFENGAPEWIGAVDQGQRQLLVENGFPEEKVVVTGHPLLSPLIANSTSVKGETPQEDRTADLQVLFVSECIAEDVRAGVNSDFGFDELDTFRVVLQAAVEVSETIGVELVVKLHPYEDSVRFEAFLKSVPVPDGVSVRIVTEQGPVYGWLLRADLVVGIGSMLLLEAMVLGRPVVSVQPGLIRENTFVPGAFGYGETLTEEDTAVSRLAGLMMSPVERQCLCEKGSGFFERIPDDSVSPLKNWIQTFVEGN